MKDNFPGHCLWSERRVTTLGRFWTLFSGIGALAENIPYAKTVQLEFEGEKSVNVRQGRFWEVGNSPYMGGKVVYSRPHLLYLAGTDWQYTDALWGSEKEYWQYKSYLPTPENMFGLRKLQNPYYFEERNQYMRLSGNRPIRHNRLSNNRNLLQPLSYAMKPPKIDDTLFPYSTTEFIEAINALSGMSYDSIQQATKTSPDLCNCQKSRGTAIRAFIIQYPQIKYNPTIETCYRVS